MKKHLSKVIVMLLTVALIATQLMVPVFAIEIEGVDDCKCDPATRTGQVIRYVDPTCCEYGYFLLNCDECYKNFTEVVEDPTGQHDLEQVDPKPVTCLEDGHDAYEYCKNPKCDYSTYEDAKISAPGSHDYIADIVDATCTTGGYTTYTCSRPDCGHSYVDDEKDPLEHNYVGSVTPPTCTEKGYTTYTCDRTNCDDTYVDDYVDALTHDYEVTMEEATCFSNAFEVHTCKRCPEVIREEILGTMLEHNEEDILEIPATCTTDGYTAGKKCTECGTITEAPELIPALQHDYDAVVTDPTCTAQGYTTYTCKRDGCGHTYVDDYVQALTHSYDDGVVTEPTCVDGGYTTFTCLRDGCGHSYQDFLTDPDTTNGHKERILKDYVAPTCTEVGYTVEQDCEYCGLMLSYQQEIPELGHDYSIDVPAVDPTCTEPGNEAGKQCSVCDDIDAVEIPALDHDWDAVVTDPTCTEDGYTTYTCKRTDCGETYVDDIVPATGHTPNLTLGTVKATCVTGGYTVYQCHCSAIYKDAFVAALGHDYDIVVTDPTCTAQGYTTYTCTRVVEDFDENYDWVCDDTVDGHTFVDDYTDMLPHPYDAVVTDPTCTEDGYTTYTCPDCGDTYVDDYVDALDHYYVGVVTDPTCTDKGYTTYTCDRCSDTYVDDYVDALDHDYDAVVTDPTCEDDGYTTYTCKRDGCGHSYVDDYVDALDHAWDSVVTAPTCTVDGFTTHTCTRCDEVKVDTIVPAAHIEEPIPAVEPTYDEEGLTEGVKCSVCDEVLVPQLPVARLSEKVYFSYEASGINGADVVNSGLVTVDIYLNVETDIARLWGIDYALDFATSMELIKIEGKDLFEKFVASPLTSANANNKVIFTQDRDTLTESVEFAQGKYHFATLTFKVDSDFFNQTASFTVDESLCVISRNHANELVVDYGTGIDVEVKMLGDANGDGKINNNDSMALSTWMADPTTGDDAYNAIFDMDKSGTIDGFDFMYLRGAIVGNNAYLTVFDQEV